VYGLLLESGGLVFDYPVKLPTGRQGYISSGIEFI
jgi:hypothetical protein